MWPADSSKPENSDQICNFWGWGEIDWVCDSELESLTAEKKLSKKGPRRKAAVVCSKTSGGGLRAGIDGWGMYISS